MAELAANIREARRRAGMTQEDLAHASGLGTGTIARLETGAADPRLSTLRQLADALNVQMWDLVPMHHHPPDPRPGKNTGAGLYMIAYPVLATVLQVLDCCTFA